MRDMVFGAVILGWTFLAAHAGMVPVAGLLGMVHAGLERFLAQLS